MPTGIPKSGKRHYLPRAPRMTVPCASCGHPVTRLACLLRSRRAFYCSRACANAGMKRAAKWAETTCAVCGNAFVKLRRYLNADPAKNFCSNKCRGLSMRREDARWKDPAQIKAYMADYIRQQRKAKPDYYRSLVRNRRARLREIGGKHTAEDIARIVAAQKGKCANCRSRLSRGMQVDHIVPLVLGGSNDATNLQALCPTCNRRKSGKHPLEFAREQGLLL